MRSDEPVRLQVSRKQEKVFLQFGLDFGTSASKVVFSQLGSKFFRALDFDHDLPGFPPYCMPSLAAIEEGRILLGNEAAKALADEPWNSGLRRFKVLLAGSKDPSFEDPLTRSEYDQYCRERSVDLSAARLSAIYLASLIKACWDRIKTMEQFRGAKLDIAFNVCVPIDHLENEAVRDEFDRVLSWAELISREWRERPRGFDALTASEELTPETHTLDPDEARVFAVPESVAEVASYLISLRKREGLHAVIDLGAGTTDVSIFNLVIPAGEATSYWYAARNIPMGTVRIERCIAQILRELGEGKCSAADVLAILSGAGRDGQFDRLAYRELMEIWKSHDYHRTWGNAYGQKLRKQSLWERVEVFLSGGGAPLPGALEVFSRPWRWSNFTEAYPVSRLPVPANYDAGSSRAPFERMAVAYGLAIPRPQLERYRLPAQTEEQTPPELPELDLEKGYVGKDQV